jgi:hypothetical protein
MHISDPPAQKNRLKSQLLESEILVLCESVLQELSTNIFDIVILQCIIFDRDMAI